MKVINKDAALVALKCKLRECEEAKDERLRRYGEMISTAINEIPSAGINEVTVLPEDIGNVCGALAKAGYVVTADKSGAISYEREVAA